MNARNPVRDGTLLWIAFILAGCVTPGLTGSGDVVSSSHDALILPLPYTRIEFPQLAPAGLTLPDFALDALKDVAGNATGKEAVIGDRITLPDEYAESKRWSSRELTELARTQTPAGLPSTAFGRGSAAVVPIYYLRGTFEGNLGVEIDGRLFVFDDVSLYAHATPHLGERIARQTLIHEFGHALGLVNCGIPMVVAREANGSPCHSDNYASVMAPYSTLSVESLLNDRWAPWHFDENDHADIAAYREAQLRASGS